MEMNLSAVVLHSFMFSDTKMIADILTETEGRTSCVVKVPRSKSSRSLRNLFQPLSLLELTVDRKSVRLMPTVKEAHLAYAYSSIPFKADKLSISFFIAEFLKATTRNGQNDPLMFRFVSESLKWLDCTKSGYANFHIAFLIRMTRFAGISPNLSNYTEGCRFDLVNGCFSAQGTGKAFLSAADAATILKLMRMNYGNMRLFRMSRTERNRCLDIIADFYRLHLPEFGELRSLDVLREMSDTERQPRRDNKQ